MKLLRRKRTTSSSSDDDTPRTPTTPMEKSSPSRGYGFPRIGKIPLTPLSKASPKGDRRSWTSDQLIDGKYDVTSKDKSVLERISQRVHRRGARVRKPHEVHRRRVLAKQKKKQGGEQTNSGVLGACSPRNFLKCVAISFLA